MNEKEIYIHLNKIYSQNSGQVISSDTFLQDLQDWSSLLFIKLVFDLEALTSKSIKNLSVPERLSFKELLNFFE